MMKKNLFIKETKQRRKPRQGIGKYLGDSRREHKQPPAVVFLTILLTLAVGIASVLFVMWLMKHEDAVARIALAWS